MYQRLFRNLFMTFVRASLVDFPLPKSAASLFISSSVATVSASLSSLLTVPILSVTVLTNLGGGEAGVLDTLYFYRFLRIVYIKREALTNFKKSFASL